MFGTETSSSASTPWGHLLPAHQYLQIGFSDTTFSNNLEAARRQYSTNMALHIRDIFAPALLATLQELCASGSFIQEATRVGAPEVESPQRVGHLLDAVLRRANFLRWLEAVTGSGPLHTFEGRLTQSRPGVGERGWHDDLREDDKRRVALVINLSPAPYQGAPFQLRLKTGEHLFEHHYTELGEALLFKVDPALAHRVPPVTAGGPRRVYAGWGLAI
jgi:hypothetical protein